MPSVTQLAVAIAVKLLVLALIVGVLRNGLHRQCWSFLVYLVMIFTYGTLELTGILFYQWPGLEWPRVLWNFEFWHFKQTAYEVIKLAVAIELGARVVAAFPGARSTARGLLVLTLLTTTAAVSLGDTPHHPLLSTATIWMFACTSLVVTFFRLPIRSWYQDLLVGFVSYLFIFTTLTSFPGRPHPGGQGPLEHRPGRLSGPRRLLDLLGLARQRAARRDPAGGPATPRSPSRLTPR